MNVETRDESTMEYALTTCQSIIYIYLFIDHVTSEMTWRRRRVELIQWMLRHETSQWRSMPWQHVNQSNTH